MPDDDDIVGLAGEYVLGTLDAGERAEAETRIDRESDFAAAVLTWETHFAPLAAAATAVQPPVYLRQRILAAVGGSGLVGNNVVQLRKQLNLWRGLTVGACALAAALAAFVLTRPLPPPLPTGGKYVAVLQPEGPGPAFVATIDLSTGTISTLRTGPAPEAGKSYELWAVGGGREKPQSLGVVGTSLKVPTAKLGKSDPATLSQTIFAISLEPEGGSPTGQPTGPVLYTGKLLATE